jgi:hypothetical protein
MNGQASESGRKSAPTCIDGGSGATISSRITRCAISRNQGLRPEWRNDSPPSRSMGSGMKSEKDGPEAGSRAGLRISSAASLPRQGRIELGQKLHEAQRQQPRGATRTLGSQTPPA